MSLLSLAVWKHLLAIQTLIVVFDCILLILVKTNKYTYIKCVYHILFITDMLRPLLKHVDYAQCEINTFYIRAFACLTK